MENIKKIKNELNEHKFNNIKFVKMIFKEDYYHIFLEIKSKLLELIVDMSKKIYFISESNSSQINDLSNLEIINIKLSKFHKDNKEFNINDIINVIDKNIISSDIFKNNNLANDKLNFYKKKKSKNKCNLDIDLIKLKFMENKIDKNKNFKNIPKELLNSSEQVFNRILSSVLKINSDYSHNHYIVPEDNNIFILSLHFKYDDKIILDKLKKLNINKDYLQIKLIIDGQLFPFIPPIIDYDNDTILNSILLFNILDLDLFKLKNWNPFLSLEWIVNNLGNALQKLFCEHLIYEKKDIYLIEKLVSFSKLTNNPPYNKINIDFNVNNIKIDKNNLDNKHWKSGIGYGFDGRNSWDINSYLVERKTNNNEIKEILKILEEYINSENILIVNNSSLYIYILDSINSSIFEICENSDLYIIIFKICKKIVKINNIPIDFLKEIYNKILVLSNDIKLIKENKELNDNNDDNIYNIILFLEEIIRKDFKLSLTKNKVIVSEDNIKERYFDIIDKNNFNNFEISKKHLFFKLSNLKADDSSKISKNRRILTKELYSLKKSLPNTWDSSILIRINEKINFIKFIVVGPKDTPYENGIFLFDVYFPDNYPEVPPKVLLRTTGNETVRFNPNLYANGKVCLSLLGTWSGDKSESWIPNLSTFLQVLISIQSFILGVSNPYFNEPSYEKRMGKEQGEINNLEYNIQRRYYTLKWAINDNIKNNIFSFEEFNKQHWILKKKEISEKINIWLNECRDYEKKTKNLSFLRNKFFEKMSKEVEIFNKLLSSELSDFSDSSEISELSEISEVLEISENSNDLVSEESNSSKDFEI